MRVHLVHLTPFLVHEAAGVLAIHYRASISNESEAVRADGGHADSSAEPEAGDEAMLGGCET
jgi:hypothetical protein